MTFTRWVPDTSWKTDPDVIAGKRCRFGAGPGHPACGAPAVAALRRPMYGERGSYWGYCAEHLYGRRIANTGTVVLVMRREDVIA